MNEPVSFAHWTLPPGISIRLDREILRRIKRKPTYSYLLLPGGVITGVSSYRLLHIVGVMLYMAFWWSCPDTIDPEAAPLHPDEGECFPVTLRLTSKGIPYGEDDGWVVLDGGWLTFTGVTCQFQVRTSDCKLRYVRSPQDSAAIDKSPLVLVFGPVQARIEPYDRQITPAGTTKGCAHRFRMAMLDWAEREATPEGNAILPPIWTQPRRVPFERLVGSILVVSILSVLWVPLSRSVHPLSLRQILATISLVLIVSGFAFFWANGRTALARYRRQVEQPTCPQTP